ncbi:eukaryotic translation initiation factor 2-alpha kinase 1 isoform X1 [Cynoglossus semilaevis]|uniref:eukaryotic translation initiation factor 2-alpha kinase 1 isoform X1 n=1 Tax=Cynoglossus semilaevis TaxID=244447 RepID=UPI000D624A34|nr:eukaryotic translation initiation factor 2-alpha kinase 1 isoform X1 [Cynoglossus semilaevis]
MFASSKRGLFQSEECSGNGSHFFALNNIKTTKRHEVSESLLSLANEEDDDVHFDTSDTDNNNEVLMAGQHYPSIHEFASAIPNHLLLGSLLEHLCFVYESNPSRAHVLFKVIGQRLAAMNLLSPLAISDEFSTVRLQHNRAFTELLNAATSSLYPQNLAASPHNPSVRPKEGLFQAQTSRYISEFEEICRLGKGSYGHVFKVMNKLDGQHYAVKKILIKKVSKDDCMKVLREVKVLSSLHHVNVVGYHTAWMEHVQPTASPTEPHLPALESPAERDSPGGQSPDNSSHGSSIVFQSLSQETSAAAAATVTIDDSESDKKSVQALVPTLDVGQIVCPKTRHGIPENFVPCVFLGKRTPLKSSKCPAMGWDSSVLLEEESSRSSMELNNNSCIDKDCLQWTDQRSHKSSNDVGPKVQFQLMLYIQMQLCERSLKEWISERNARPRGEGNKDPYSCVDTEHALCLLRNILEGVEYIHSRGIMHRDLKVGR